ncbi:MAG TPA: cytosine permease [Gaiellaceae bacterium]|nr:cytosine permease [Gaiellaceae bacterium]
MAETPSWGIEPVPDRLRRLGLVDSLALWGNLGISLLVLVAGTYLVPALSLKDALLAILVGGLIGNAMLGLAGLIGSDARVPAMVLLRAPLGRRGSYLATVLNVLQNLGWATFELIVIATAAGALSQKVFGFEARWAWTIGFGALTFGFALLGPVDFVRTWVKRFALWVVLASLAYLTWWTLDGAGLHTLWSQPGTGGLSFWGGIDLVIAMPASWLPLAADYTRFSRNGRTAFVGSGLGYLVPNLWLFALGALLLLSRDLADPTDLLTTIAAGGLGGGLALLALTVDETDEPFANVYSAAVSLQNLLPRAPQALLVGAVAAVSTGAALALNLGRYLDFLYLLGSAFVPLFGVLLGHWLASGAHYGRDDVFRAPALRLELLAAWAAGFCLYQWLEPVGPGWWTSLVERTGPHALPWGGASIPSLAASFALAALLRLAWPRIAALAPGRA